PAGRAAAAAGGGARGHAGRDCAAEEAGALTNARLLLIRAPAPAQHLPPGREGVVEPAARPHHAGADRVRV
ncbi:hypothetical protein, partial [Acinetobacter baumannii]|uniref:hypothetical protein n=1 Tax=Acinetobacter baumannii TaxID=470 RepID=UPI0014879006